MIQPCDACDNRFVGKPDNQEANAAKEMENKRQVSAIKTILLISGTYFLLYIPFFIIRLVLFGSASAVDVEMRRSQALTLVVRCATILMSIVTPVLNPALHLSTRKRLKAALLEQLPWLHNLSHVRVRRIEVAVITGDSNVK
jgi:hypothetical protein